MSTFQQIALGAFCVGAAFMLGHVLNHQNPPVNPLESNLPAAAHEPSPASSERKETGAMLPNFRTQSSLGFELDKEVDLPPPSQLDSARGGEARASESIAGAEEIDIEVPDFTALAAQFKGSLLELPPLEGEKNIANTHTENSGIGRADAGSTPIAPSRNDPGFQQAHRRPHLPDNEKSLIPTIHLTAEPPDYEAEEKARNRPQEILPIQPPIQYKVDDFAPRLRGDSAISAIGPEPESPSAAPQRKIAEEDRDRSVLEYQARNSPSVPESSWQAPAHPNAVVSYNDPFPSHSSRINKVPTPIHPAASHNQVGETRPAGESEVGSPMGSWTPRNPTSSLDPTQAKAITPQSAETGQPSRRSVPFGLNDENRTRLSRLTTFPGEREHAAATKFRNYQTQSGDTLYSISVKFFGTRDYYLDIYLANRDRLRNPAEVPAAGIPLRIPVYE
jgi:hypothetical protein